MASATDIDRLIEEGLNRYGAGDLDGALLAWEEALAIDPENAQANSYVDYVRMNYELLQTDTGPNVVFDDAGMPFGIAEEPEYVIEIVAGEALIGVGEPTAAPMYMDPLDEGWFIEEEATRDLTQQTKARTRSKDLEGARTISADLPPQTLELEAEEPPAPVPEVSFESSTREYGKDGTPSQATNEFMDDLSSFRAEATPLGFGQMETEIKKRDLGFVQPTQGPARMEVRLRTPSTPPPKDASLDLELGEAGNDLNRTTRGMPPIQKTPASVNDDLIDSLPSPRRVTPVRGSPVIPDPAARIVTRDMPPTSRAPAPALDFGDIPEDLALASASTRDLNERLATAPASPTALGRNDDPLVVAVPTRELGLRPKGRPPSVYPDEDAPTRQSDARAIRADAAAKAGRRAEDGTRQDIILPFDPIDARSAQILDDIDAEGSNDEPKEDRTRRRITALLDRALAWNSGEELDKAVCAVDLALSEDPNSALAQKLIHRNRDTIMTVFQNYLGDLERQPQLARPLHELSSAPISPRAAFLLSRIDGTLTIDEILDVSGMPRLEAYRHLCQLFLRGILR